MMSQGRIQTNGADAFVTRSELHETTNHTIEAIGSLTAEVGRLAAKVDVLITDVREVKAQTRAKLRALPDLVAREVEEAEEVTAVRNLKSELHALKKRDEGRNKVIAGALVSIAVALVLHFLFHIG